jgi:hypothetical protein
MIILPNQFFGIGDVIFTQTLVRRIAASHGEGTKIVWGVLNHFVDGLNRAYPDITFVDYRKIPIDYERRDDYYINLPEYGECRVLPIRWACENLKLPYDECMSAKYQMYGMDYQDWRQDAIWKQDIDRCVFNTVHEKYTLVNRTFGSDGKMQVNIPKQENEIELTNLAGFSLFDWANIIKDANDIHTVNTSIIYLLELLDLRAKEVHLYQRPIKGQTFENIRYLLKRNKYIFHG